MKNLSCIQNSEQPFTSVVIFRKKLNKLEPRMMFYKHFTKKSADEVNASSFHIEKLNMKHFNFLSKIDYGFNISNKFNNSL